MFPEFEPHESRIGGDTTGGKCTHRLDTPVPEHLYDTYASLAGLAGKTKAEYVRAVLEQHAFGAMAFARARAGLISPGSS